MAISTHDGAITNQQHALVNGDHYQWQYMDQQQKEKALLNPNMLRFPRHQVLTNTAPAPDDALFDIHTIILEGVTKLSRAEQYFLIQPYIGPVGVIHIQQLMADIQNTYIRKGYITTKPYPKPGQNIASGTLTIHVEEGRIAAIVDDSGQTTLALRMAFPFLEGKVLNIRDLEQGLDQMNRLASNRMKINLIPQQPSEGYGTIVQVLNLNKNPLKNRVSLHVSDTQDAFQLYPQRVDISRDNLLGVNDQWNVSFLQDTRKKHQSNGTWLSLSMPFGYALGTVQFSRFEYHQLHEGVFRYFSMTGQTNRLSLGLSKTLFRTQRSKTDAAVQLTQNKSAHSIEDVLNEPASRILSVAELGLNHTLYGWMGAIWMMDIRYHKGLRFWGAPKDPVHVTHTTPRFQFEKTTFSGTMLKQAMIGWMPVAFKSFGRAQFSPHVLFSSEQMVMGGALGVRGGSSTFMGDSGAVFQQEVSVFMHDAFPWDAWNDFSKPLGLQFVGGIDLGAFRLNSSQAGAAMVGGIVGIRHVSQSFSAEWMMAKLIRSSSGMPMNTPVIYWNMAFQLV